MQVISTFEHSHHIELALVALEKMGIEKEDIFAVPLDRIDKIKMFDSIHRSDGMSLFDVAAALGATGMVFGAIYGFVLAWGPIIWGLIGLVFGALIGFVLDVIISKRNPFKEKDIPEILSEVVIIVECEEHQVKMIKKTFKDYNALGIGMLK